MANVYKKNLDALKRINPFYKDCNTILEYIDLSEEYIKLEDGILLFRKGKDFYQAHSSHPEEEAERLINKLNDYEYKDNLVVLFGISNIVLLKKLWKQTSDGTRIAIFEPNAYVLKYILKTVNLTDFFDSGKFALIYGDERIMSNQINFYFSQKWENLVQNFNVLSLPNYYLYQEYRLEYIKKVADKIDSYLKAFGTSLEDMLDGFSNHYQNVDTCCICNGLDEIRGKYKGKPAILVSAGPSLDKNIKDLKDAEGKALILSCDACYNTCLENGVHPEGIATMERYRPTYEYFYEGRHFAKDLVLIGPTLLWPEIFENFEGKKLLMAKSGEGVEGWWSSHFPQIDFLSMGHSCATAAFALAIEAGCNPIILIGSDLAFTDEKRHSESAHRNFKSTNDATNSKSDLWVESIDGGKVRTTFVFNLFRAFYEQCAYLRTDRVMINATEGGALIHGMKNMTLKEAIQTYCKEQIGFKLSDLLEERIITNEEKIKKYDELIESARDSIERLKLVQDRAVNHYNILKEYKDFNYEHATEEELRDIVLNMQAANDIVTYIITEQKDLVSYYQQIIKQTIIYVKKIGNRLTSENVKRNWELQANLMYMIDVATVATSKRFSEMIEFMERKKALAQEAIS